MTDRLKQRASAAGESLRERASDLGERAGELGHEARRRARHYGRSGGRYVKDHPILFGAPGITLAPAVSPALRAERRRGGQAGVRPCETRWRPVPSTQKKNTKNNTH